MEATAKRVEGDISFSFNLIDLMRLSAVSFNPFLTSQYLSVLAVHRTITCSIMMTFNSMYCIIIPCPAVYSV